MLFYLALAVVCVFVAILSVWLFRLISKAGPTFYQVFLPSAPGKRRKAKPHHFNPNPTSARTPWGRGRKSVVHNQAKAQDAMSKQLGHGDTLVQWTYRKEALRSSTQPASKLNREDDPEPGTVIKPWGW